MADQKKTDSGNPFGRIVLTGAITWAVWKYPPGPYPDPTHQVLWWSGVALAGLGAYRTLSNVSLGESFKWFRAFGHDETRGSARWMTRREIRKAKLHKRKKESRFIGIVFDVALWLRTETHHLILGPAGSQKTTAAIMNFLMCCSESALITDIKGELWLTTRAYRERTFGHRCVKIDPKDPANSAKINFLDPIAWYVENNDPAALTTVRGLFLQLSPDPKGGGGQNAVFYLGARSLLVTTSLSVIEALPQEYRNLAMVYRVLSDLDLLHDVLSTASKSQSLNGEIADMASATMQAAFGDGPDSKTFESFRTNALLALESFGPGNYLARITNETTLDFADLKREKLSAYVLIDQANVAVMEKFAGALQWMASNAMVASGNNKPVLFILDEFCNAPVYTLPKILTLLRSAGVRCILATQDLDDIVRVFDKHALETVLSETYTKQILSGVKSKTTLEYLSSYMGDYTETVSSFSFSDAGIQESVSSANKKLLSPDQLRTLHQDAQIVLHGNYPPILAKKCQVFSVEPWRNEIAINTQYSDRRFLLPVEVKLSLFGSKVTWRGKRAYKAIWKSVQRKGATQRRRMLENLFTKVLPLTSLLMLASLAIGIYAAGLPNLRWEYGYRGGAARNTPVSYVWCRYVGPTAPETVAMSDCPLILWRKTW